MARKQRTPRRPGARPPRDTGQLRPAFGPYVTPEAFAASLTPSFDACTAELERLHAPNGANREFWLSGIGPANVQLPAIDPAYSIIIHNDRPCSVRVCDAGGQSVEQPHHSTVAYPGGRLPTAPLTDATANALLDALAADLDVGILGPLGDRLEEIGDERVKKMRAVRVMQSTYVGQPVPHWFLDPPEVGNPEVNDYPTPAMALVAVCKRVLRLFPPRQVTRQYCFDMADPICRDPHYVRSKLADAGIDLSRPHDVIEDKSARRLIIRQTTP